MNVIKPVGARTLKTSITVFLCYLLSTLLLKNSNTLIVCVSGIMCIQNTLEDSMEKGKSRVLGTVVGGVVGFIGTLSYSFGVLPQGVYALIAAIGILVTIYVCLCLSLNFCIPNACVTFLAIFINSSGETWFVNAFGRVVDTLLGVLIALLINRFLFVKSFENVVKEND